MGIEKELFLQEKSTKSFHKLQFKDSAKEKKKS